MTYPLLAETPSITATAHEPEASARGPVIVFFVSSVAWLVASCAFEVAWSWKLNFPWLLDSAAWLTFGRLRPAGQEAFVYGWAATAGAGCGMWMLAKLLRVRVPQPGVLICLALFWNLWVLLGVVGILAGFGASLPQRGGGVLLLPALLLGLWCLAIFRQRKSGPIPLAGRCILGAFVAFPLILGTADALLVWFPVKGSAQGPVQGWFAQSLLVCWLLPLGLACLYEIIPDILRRPLAEERLPSAGLWLLVFVSGWGGLAREIAGPLPAWMAKSGSVAGLGMGAAVVALAWPLHRTLEGRYAGSLKLPALRFAVFGLGAFVVAGIEALLLSVPAISAVTGFTDLAFGHQYLWRNGFFTMAVTGAITHIAPSLLSRAWPSVALARWHFRLAATGVALACGCLTLGGFLQGVVLADPGFAFEKSVAFAMPFRMGFAVANILIFAANGLFFFHLLLLLWGRNPHVSNGPSPSLPQT